MAYDPLPRTSHPGAIGPTAEQAQQRPVNAMPGALPMAPGMIQNPAPPDMLGPNQARRAAKQMYRQMTGTRMPRDMFVQMGGRAEPKKRVQAQAQPGKLDLQGKLDRFAAKHPGQKLPPGLSRLSQRTIGPQRGGPTEPSVPANDFARNFKPASPVLAGSPMPKRQTLGGAEPYKRLSY